MKNVLLAEVTSKLKKNIYMAHKTATEIVTLGGIDSFYVLVFFFLMYFKGITVCNRRRL